MDVNKGAHINNAEIRLRLGCNKSRKESYFVIRKWYNFKIKR